MRSNFLHVLRHIKNPNPQQLEIIGNKSTLETAKSLANFMLSNITTLLKIRKEKCLQARKEKSLKAKKSAVLTAEKAGREMVQMLKTEHEKYLSKYWLRKEIKSYSEQAFNNVKVTQDSIFNRIQSLKTMMHTEQLSEKISGCYEYAERVRKSNIMQTVLSIKTRQVEKLQTLLDIESKALQLSMQLQDLGVVASRTNDHITLQKIRTTIKKMFQFHKIITHTR